MGLGLDCFEFLAQLDTLEGRLLDNADFSVANDPDSVPDADFYDLLIRAYPVYLRAARAAGLLPAGPGTP